MIGRVLLMVSCVATVGVWSIPDGCEDVALVGGGVGGAYAAWRLRQRGLQLSLYEISNRIGGRFYTHTFPQAPDIPVELGAMRFIREKHKVLYRTIQEVGLRTGLFEQKTPHDVDTLYLRGRHLSLEDFDLDNDNVPYNLRPHESRGLEALFSFLTQKTNFSGNIDSLEQEKPFMISDDGDLMSNQTLREFYRKYLSIDASELLGPYGKFSLDIPAMSGIVFTSANGSIPNVKMMTLPDGMQQLPEKLVKQFLSSSRKHSLHLNHELISIDGNIESGYNLTFKRTGTGHMINVCSRKVILAVPMPALLQIKWAVVQTPRIKRYLNTVAPLEALKIYLVYDHPWWREKTLNDTESQTQTPRSHSTLFSDIPLQQTYDFGVSAQTGKAVLLVSYTAINSMFWRELQKHGDRRRAGHYSVSTEVVRHTHLYLARLYDILVTDIPHPLDGIISQWHKHPYNGPYCMWNTGVDWERVWRTVNKPSLLDDVFIASGAYWSSESDTWSENCLNAVNEILQNYF